MLFDPDAGLSLEEVIRRKWKTEWSPELKAKILEVAARRGCTVWDVVLDCLVRFADKLDDPIKRQEMKAWRERWETPLGNDPHLEKDR